YARYAFHRCHLLKMCLYPSTPKTELSLFFFNSTATTEIYTLSLHDALPISSSGRASGTTGSCGRTRRSARRWATPSRPCSSGPRSEEHTSELQSLAYLVCRLLLEKKKMKSILILICFIDQ